MNKNRKKVQMDDNKKEKKRKRAKEGEEKNRSEKKDGNRKASVLFRQKESCYKCLLIPSCLLVRTVGCACILEHDFFLHTQRSPSTRTKANRPFLPL